MLMLDLFLFLVNHGVPSDTARARAWNIVEVAYDNPPLFDDEDQYEASRKTAFVLATMMVGESGGKHDVIGDKDSPYGPSYGLLQAKTMWHMGWTKDDVLRDPIIGLTVGLEAMRTMRKKCGPKATVWLGAYASGKCGGAPEKIRYRLSRVEGINW
jgi:hypothetical protein